MASHIVALRDVILDAIREAVPEFAEVSPHGGMFTADQIKRFALRAPACRLAFLGVPREEVNDTGELRGPVTFCAYIIAQDMKWNGKRAESWDVAAELAERLAGFVQGNTFGYARSGAAEVMEIDNLFAMQEEKVGYTLMAVSWRQMLRFGVNTYAADTAGDPDAWMDDITTLNSVTVVENGTADETPIEAP